MAAAPRGSEVWRDYVTDGIPSSGANKPQKADIRSWSSWLESMVTSGVLSSGPWFATKAAMTLGYAANTVAIVYNDPTAANNGLYIKSGASGSGSWTQLTSFLPGYQFVTASPTGASTANAIVASTSPRLPAGDGVALVTLAIPATNTASPVTVQFDGGAVLTIKTRTGENPDAGELQQNDVVAGFVSGATFRLISDLNSLRNFQSAKAWANNAEDVPVSTALGGDGVTTFSARHWAAKSDDSADRADNEADRSQVARAGAESAAGVAAGYVNDIVSEKEVPITGTVQGLTAIDLPPGMTAIRTNGFSAMGDLGAWPLAVEVPNVGPLEKWQRQTNGGARRWEPRANVIDAAMFGFSVDATALQNSEAVNAAIRFQHFSGGGTVAINKPGEYLLGNTNPYPASSYPGLTEENANWWANRRAIWIPYDNITLQLGQGVKLKVGDGENCHAIQMGQFSLGMGGFGPPIVQASLHNSKVIGDGWSIDMNGPNQMAATENKFHPAGIIAQHGSSGLEIGGGHIYNSSYYGMGFEGSDTDALRGFQRCYVHDMLIENCMADGFDAKDFGTLSADNVIARVVVKNCGNSSAFLSEQAGIDVRGGWLIAYCTVYFDDAFTGARVGIRTQYAPGAAKSGCPSRLIICRAVGNGKANANTIGYRIAGYGSRMTDCAASGFAEGLRTSIPDGVIDGLKVKQCGIALRCYFDTGAGWNASNTVARAFVVEDCDTPYRTDTGVVGFRWQGGAKIGTVGAPVENGTGTIIRDVSGMKTYSQVVSAEIAVDTTGRKTFTINHGLAFTPTEADVSFTLIRTAFDANLAISEIMVNGVSASQVACELYVTSAGASGRTVKVAVKTIVKSG